MAVKSVSCGVIVTDGERLVLGHATRSPRWDIPKGMAEPGESLVDAARRELFEETGLDAPEAELKPLGVAPYRSGKDLALFAWAVPVLPDPATLHCASCFDWRGNMLPEFDHFGEIVSGVDVHHRERQRRRTESLLRQPKQDDGVFTGGEQQHRALEFGNHLTDDVHGFCFQQPQLVHVHRVGARGIGCRRRSALGGHVGSPSLSASAR